jgi:hypothetical protein
VDTVYKRRIESPEGFFIPPPTYGLKKLILTVMILLGEFCERPASDVVAGCVEIAEKMRA